jgi:hypothetical protein
MGVRNSRPHVAQPASRRVFYFKLGRTGCGDFNPSIKAFPVSFRTLDPPPRFSCSPPLSLLHPVRNILRETDFFGVVRLVSAHISLIAMRYSFYAVLLQDALHSVSGLPGLVPLAVFV